MLPDVLANLFPLLNWCFHASKTVCIKLMFDTMLNTFVSSTVLSCLWEVIVWDILMKRTWPSDILWNFIAYLSSQAIINSTITPNMTFTKTSQKFGQWSDARANTVYGLGFNTEAELAKVRIPGFCHTLIMPKYHENFLNIRREFA